MRIGELAAIAGVTTRTVRYYHRVGLLPEPDRRLNGYREYGMRDAVMLVRVRRLVELGLSLDEVRDALDDDAGKALTEILTELDADLARQETAIRKRRAALAELLERTRSGSGLGAEGPVSAELAALFAEMAQAGADRAGPEPAAAGKDRELLAMLEASAGPGHGEWFSALTGALSGDPGAMARAYEVYASFDELAEADAHDPRIPELAAAMANTMPEGPTYAASPSDDGTFAEAFFADFPPAQAEVLRRAAELLRERGRP